jgi:hypothetical protein
MSNAVPPAKPAPAEVLEDDEKNPLEAGPPDEEFWEKYSAHLEFPLSTVGAILLHVLVGAFIVFVLFRLANQGADRSSVPLKLVEVGGFDEFGQGSEGSGGVDDPIARGDSNPLEQALKDIMPLDQLPEAKQNMQDLLKEIDPKSDFAVSAQAAAAYSTLDKTLKEKMLGMQRGAGKEKGGGYDGTAGTGPGGTGADSTRARTMRWVLRFRTSSGRDYLDQLHAMGGVVAVPVPPENKKLLFFDNLQNPNGRIANSADEARMAQLLQFNDGRRESVDAVARELKLDFTPKAFWAFFPKEVEDDLGRKEKNYRNRRPEDIEETIFTVSYRGGTFQAVVYDQVAKRGR